MSTIIAALIGLGGVTIAATIARLTAQSIAELNAAQKRRDAELLASKEYADLVITTAGAIEAYVWYASDEIISKRTVTEEAWHGAKDYVVPLRTSISRLQFLGTLVVDPTVKALHTSFLQLAESVFAAPGDDGMSARALWNRAVDAGNQPDTVTQLVQAAHDLRARQLHGYPTEAPGLWRSALGPSRK
ncbi:hypothetical protein JGU71_26845 [Antrihabitans sp. YC3-6]|uniref:Uncharacterized protein n=1 Tax=Antrihabitans stalagmiti TaxID=2799499 RepID=A0A934U711_9NOCA|nr:hypothetical protein [Antrihabitans stalagmiti]MBJ8342513.1 hypothetical protein [Antrihabitans stalagmiti]